jgi:hypothetical protein
MNVKKCFSIIIIMNFININDLQCTNLASEVIGISGLVANEMVFAPSRRCPKGQNCSINFFDSEQEHPMENLR